MVSMPATWPTSLPSDNLPSSPGQSSRNVIDLTDSPSSSPAPLPPPSLPRPQSQPPQFPAGQPTTFENSPPKTPVCIGRLGATALIVYPSVYLDIPPSEPSVWGPVRLVYERTPHHTGSSDTLFIRTPNKSGPNEEVHHGETFGVVEQDVASVLGPMLGKGLIRVDSRIRRGNQHLPVLPLDVLVYTPKGNIPVIGNFLRQSGFILEHPSIYPIHVFYHNPHNPPPGDHARALMTGSLSDHSGPGMPESVSMRGHAMATMSRDDNLMPDAGVGTEQGTVQGQLLRQMKRRPDTIDSLDQTVDFPSCPENIDLLMRRLAV